MKHVTLLSFLEVSTLAMWNGFFASNYPWVEINLKGLLKSSLDGAPCQSNKEAISQLQCDVILKNQPRVPSHLFLHERIYLVRQNQNLK